MKVIFSILLRVLSVALFFILWFYPAPKVIELKIIDWHDEYKRYSQNRFSFDGFSLVDKSNPGKTSLESFITRKVNGKTILLTESQWQFLISNTDKSQQKKGTPSYVMLDTVPSHWTLKPETYLVRASGDNTSMIRLRPHMAYDYGWSSAPGTLRYPYRNYWWQILFLCAVLFVSGSFINKGPRSVIQKSTAFTGFSWGTGIFLLSISGIAAPILYDMPGMRGGFALFFIGGFVAIGGIITMSVFGFQLRALKKMLSGIDILAHWTYSPAEWQAFTELEFKEMKGENLQKWILVAAISLIIGVAFMLIMRDKASVQVFVFLMGFLVFLAFVAWVVPQLGYRRNRREPGEVFIAETGACINGSVHTWNLLDATLDSVELTHDKRLLVFIYSYLTRYGRESVPLRIPVPSGQESKALDIVSHFHGRL